MIFFATIAGHCRSPRVSKGDRLNMDVSPSLTVGLLQTGK